MPPPITDQLRKKLRNEPISFTGIVLTMLLAISTFLSPTQVIITGTGGEELARVSAINPIILIITAVLMLLFGIMFFTKLK